MRRLRCSRDSTSQLLLTSPHQTAPVSKENEQFIQKNLKDQQPPLTLTVSPCVLSAVRCSSQTSSLIQGKRNDITHCISSRIIGRVARRLWLEQCGFCGQLLGEHFSELVLPPHPPPSRLTNSYSFSCIHRPAASVLLVSCEPQTKLAWRSTKSAWTFTVLVRRASTRP
jgi:hypothetical protein